MTALKSLLRVALVGAALSVAAATAAAQSLLNTSYDPTRELYQDFNAAFIKYWKAKTGQTVSVKQAHGGSGGQARALQAAEAFDMVPAPAVKPDHRHADIAVGAGDLRPRFRGQRRSDLPDRRADGDLEVLGGRRPGRFVLGVQIH